MRQFQAFCFRIQSLAAILRDVARLLQKKGKCMLEFQFVGFTPRAVFKEAANKKIAELSQHMPQGSNFSARVIMIDSKFFFQVMCVNKTECFIAKEVLDPKKENTESRDWQIVGVERALDSLDSQLSEWRCSKVA